MNVQEIFDTVSRHLLVQRRQAKLGEDRFYTCAYHAEDGAKCAVGCLIKDEFYSSDLEDVAFSGDPIRSHEVVEAVEKSIGELDEESKVMLARLQYIHDRNNRTGWSDRLRELGLELSLDVSVLSEFKSFGFVPTEEQKKKAVVFPDEDRAKRKSAAMRDFKNVLSLTEIEHGHLVELKNYGWVELIPEKQFWSFTHVEHPGITVRWSPVRTEPVVEIVD